MQCNWFQSRFFCCSLNVYKIFFELYVYAIITKQNLQTYSNRVNFDLQNVRKECYPRSKTTIINQSINNSVPTKKTFA